MINLFSWSIILKILHVCEALLLRDRRPKWYWDLTTGERYMPCYCKVHVILHLSTTFNFFSALHLSALRFDNLLPVTPIGYMFIIGGRCWMMLTTLDCVKFQNHNNGHLNRFTISQVFFVLNFFLIKYFYSKPFPR